MRVKGLQDRPYLCLKFQDVNCSFHSLPTSQLHSHPTPLTPHPASISWNIHRSLFWNLFGGWGSSRTNNTCLVLRHRERQRPMRMLINEDLPAGLQLVFTLNNRFFRHQACYSLLPAKPGGQADRVVSLCKYKVVGCTPSYVHDTA